MLVEQLMRTPVITIAPDAGLDRALVMMRTQRIRHLPVVDKGELVGIITDRDLRLSMLEMEGPQNAPKGLYLPALTKVRAVMKTAVHTVSTGDSVQLAAKAMCDHKIGGLPVLERGSRRLAGILTESDMLRLLSKILTEKNI